MRKLLAPVVMIGVVAAIGVPTPAVAADQPATDRPPDAFAQNQRLGRGVNVLGYDPIWTDREKARFQEKHFRLIKQAGFSHVRVNLHPFRDNPPAAGHQLTARWFETLDWASSTPGTATSGWSWTSTSSTRWATTRLATRSGS